MKNKIRKIFEVLINDKPYSVYDIEGKEHSGLNGEPKTWWVYYSAESLPFGLLPPIDSEYWQEYHVGINRRLWEIKIKQRNTTKSKWDSINFSNNTHVEMWCNNKLIYSFGTTGGSSGLSYAFAKIQYMQILMSEHCYNFFDAYKENGRKIWWMGLPAKIKVKHNTWEIAIIPDYTAGILKTQWWDELEKRQTKLGERKKDDFDEMEKDDFKEEKRSDYINWGDAFEDKHINWFRD